MHTIRMIAVVLVLSGISTLSHGQSSAMGAPVPNLVNFTGTLKDSGGQPIESIAGVTFSLYAQEEGGVPLWVETQNVQVDAKGNYTVRLGATKAEGLPLELFTSGTARWLGVRINDGDEQPRVLLVSVPYALKAADAQTLGGLPPSAFMLAAPTVAGYPFSSPAFSPADVSTAAVSGTGTTDFVPLWTNSTGSLGNSILFQSGTGTTAKVGINATIPAATLDVNGTENVRSTLTHTATGTATATGGKNSAPEDFVASVFNSETETAVPQKFQWQAEAVGNNTASASGVMSLLHATGTAAASETGLKINSKGQITFASGQTFPGTTKGTVTSVGLTAPSSDFTVSGSPVTGSGTVALNWTVVPTSAATSNAIVKRDASGNFSANMVTASGVQVRTAASEVYAIFGAATAGTGVGGGTASDDPQASGVEGITSSSTSSGIFGSQTLLSNAGKGHGYSAGIWGDSCCGVAMLGTSDDSNALVGVNNSSTGYTTAYLNNESTNAAAYVLYTNGSHFGGACSVDVKGNLACSGSKSAVVALDGGKRRVALSAIESPQNWFEDFGSAHLVNGVAVVRLDPDFIQAVNADMDYKVFPVPDGDCKGLYVANKTATSFEVRELGGGASNVSFDYRVTALRRNYENVRFADHTNDPVPYKAVAGAKSKAVRRQ